MTHLAGTPALVVDDNATSGAILTGFLREWGLELADNRHLVVDTTMRTNVPGVFAAGDITEYPGKVRLISVGFGEVATAVNNAAVHLNPNAHVFPGHTSNEPHEVPVPA